MEGGEDHDGRTGFSKATWDRRYMLVDENIGSKASRPPAPSGGFIEIIIVINAFPLTTCKDEFFAKFPLGRVPKVED